MLDYHPEMIGYALGCRPSKPPMPKMSRSMET
jgi:hypothetical protein